MSSIPFTLLVPATAAGVYLLAAFAALARRSSRPEVYPALLAFLLAAALWSGIQAAWQLGWLSGLVPAFVKGLVIDGVLVLVILHLALARAFFQGEALGWPWGLAGAAWLGLVILLDSDLRAVPQVLWRGNGQILSRDAGAFAALMLGWGFFTLATTVLTGVNLRKELSPPRRNRLDYWVLGLGLVVLGEGLFLSQRPVLGGGLRVAGAAVTAMGLLAEVLPEISRAVRVGLSYLVSRGAAMLIFTLVFLGLSGSFVLFSRFTQLPPILLAAAGAAVVVFVLNPALDRLQRWITDVVAGRERDTARILRRYTQGITHITDLKLLTAMAVSTAGEALGIYSGCLFIVNSERDGDGRSFYRLRGEQGVGGRPGGVPGGVPWEGRLADDSPLADFFRRDHSLLTTEELRENPRFEDLSGNERDWLDVLGMEVLVPIYAKDEWIGLLALGPKNSGAAYSQEDLNLASILADHTGVAMENVRLVEGLTRLNEQFRRAYTALEQAKLQLERLDRTKSDFISIASHELRTPLTVLSGASQMLLADPALQEDPYYSQLLDKIVTGAARMHEVVDSMLDMAKIDTRELKLDPQPIALSGLVRSVCAGLDAAAEERSIRLEVQEMANLPHIEGDVEALRKVFYHLLVNAIKYTPDGGRVTISGHPLSTEHGAFSEGGVKVTVADTGIGIDPRYHELIFTKFYQTGELALHSTGRTNFKGAGPGLGLAITKGIVEAHAGRVWVESPRCDEQTCPGSRFHVTLPVRQPARLPQPTRMPTPSRPLVLH